MDEKQWVTISRELRKLRREVIVIAEQRSESAENATPAFEFLRGLNNELRVIQSTSVSTSCHLCLFASMAVVSPHHDLLPPPWSHVASCWRRASHHLRHRDLGVQSKTVIGRLCRKQPTGICWSSEGDEDDKS